MSPDGSVIATASGDGTVGVWDRATGAQLAELRHNGPVLAIAFSPSGDRVLSASDDGSARIWSVESGDESVRIQHLDRVNDARYSADGSMAITAGRDGVARVWDVGSGTVMVDLQHPDVVWAAAISPDGKRAATVSNDAVTRLWSLPNGEMIAEVEHGGPTEVVSFSPDGRWLFAGGQGGVMHFLDGTSGSVVFTPESGARGGVLGVSWHPDGQEAAVAALGSGITRFDLATGEVLSQYRQPGGVRAVIYSPDGEWLAGASGDFAFNFGDVSFWDLATGRKLVHLSLVGPAGALAVDENGSMLVAGYRTTIDLVETGGAWVIPAERAWAALACESTDGEISASTWAEIVGDDEPFVRSCP